MDRPDSDEIVELPGFTDQLREQMQNHLQEGVGRDIVVSDGQWVALRDILNAYVLDAKFWKGFPTAERLEPVLAVRKKSSALIIALEQLRSSDMAYVLEFSADEAAQLNDLLRALSTLDLRSPRVLSEMDTGDERHRDTSRESLLSKVENWWTSVSGLKSTSVKSDTTTLFHRFVEQAYSAIPPEYAPGNSYSAIKNIRTMRKKRERKEGELSAAFAATLRKIGVRTI